MEEEHHVAKDNEEEEEKELDVDDEYHVESGVKVTE